MTLQGKKNRNVKCDLTYLCEFVAKYSFVHFDVQRGAERYAVCVAMSPALHLRAAGVTVLTMHSIRGRLECQAACD